MSQVQDVINLARSQVGYIERPTNRTKYGVYYGMDGAAWCAMFLSWCHAQVNQRHFVNFSTSRGYAYTPAGVEGFKSRGQFRPSPQLGAHVFYRFSGNRVHHVGLVVGIGNGWIEAVEGNTSRGSRGSQSDGGGVWLRRRSSGIVGYGVPPYSAGSSAPTQTTTEEEEMIVPVNLAPGESKVFHIEPPTGGWLGNAGRAVLVLNTHGINQVNCYVWRQRPGGPGDVVVAAGFPYVLEVGEGWLHVANRGKVEVGGQILYRR